ERSSSSRSHGSRHSCRDDYHPVPENRQTQSGAGAEDEAGGLIGASANGLRSRRVVPVRASSARASPIAAECLKPWPEQGEATMMRSQSGWRSITKRESGV